MSSSPLKDGGVVNRDSGEILDMDSVPPEYRDRYLNHIEQYLDQYRDHVEVDEMGYTTLPNDKFKELSDELKELLLLLGKPKKQWKAPYQINRMKVG